MPTKKIVPPAKMVFYCGKKTAYYYTVRTNAYEQFKLTNNHDLNIRLLGKKLIVTVGENAYVYVGCPIYQDIAAGRRASGRVILYLTSRTVDLKLHENIQVQTEKALTAIKEKQPAVAARAVKAIQALVTK